MRQVNFDMDVLRSFVTGMDAGSFARAADRLGRSTSAVSSHLRKLEEQAGTPIFRKSGRGLALTEAGDAMLSYARRLLELNDEAAAAVRGVQVEGWVRLGVQEDFGDGLLPKVLARFRRAHPKVRIEAKVARNAELLESVARGKLDLALAWEAGLESPRGEPLLHQEMCWIGPSDPALEWPDEIEVPLVAFEMPCLFRTAATAALDAARVPWRVVFTSPSLSGLWAAAAAGIGVSVRTRMGLPPSLRVVAPGERGLPLLGRSLPLSMHVADSEPGPATARLADILRQTVRAEWGQTATRPPQRHDPVPAAA